VVARGAICAAAGVRPIESVESDEEYEAFLADLYASRRAGLA
jgi:hypothetical protein